MFRGFLVALFNTQCDVIFLFIFSERLSDPGVSNEGQQVNLHSSFE